MQGPVGPSLTFNDRVIHPFFALERQFRRLFQSSNDQTGSLQLTMEMGFKTSVAELLINAL